VPFEKRIQNLLMEYTSGTVNELEEAVMRIERRIGLENTAKAVQMIRSCNMAGAAEIILKYYDKIYARSMTMHKRKSLFEISINTEDPVRIAEIIISNNQKWN